MDGMTISDYAQLQEMQHSKHEGWGSTTALWVIVAVIIIAAIVYNWTKNCNEKVQFSTALASLSGKIECMTPVITSNANQLFTLNGVVASTVQGVKDMDDSLYQLNKEVFYDVRGNRRSGCGCGNREFRQSSVYNLASTNVTVDETCRN